MRHLLLKPWLFGIIPTKWGRPIHIGLDCTLCNHYTIYNSKVTFLFSASGRRIHVILYNDLEGTHTAKFINGGIIRHGQTNIAVLSVIKTV